MKLELSGRYNLDLMVPVCLIFLAELLIFWGNMQAAMIIHAINLIFIILASIYINNRVYPILMLLPLFRLLNVAMPIFSSSRSTPILWSMRPCSYQFTSS